MLDGNIYQIASDGRVTQVGDDALTPFSCVTFYKPFSSSRNWKSRCLIPISWIGSVGSCLPPTCYMPFVWMAFSRPLKLVRSRNRSVTDPWSRSAQNSRFFIFQR